MVSGLGVVEGSSDRDQLHEKMGYSEKVQGETDGIVRYLGDNVETQCRGNTLVSIHMILMKWLLIIGDINY